MHAISCHFSFHLAISAPHRGRSSSGSGAVVLSLGVESVLFPLRQASPLRHSPALRARANGRPSRVKPWGEMSPMAFLNAQPQIRAGTAAGKRGAAIPVGRLADPNLSPSWAFRGRSRSDACRRLPPLRAGLPRKRRPLAGLFPGTDLPGRPTIRRPGRKFPAPPRTEHRPCPPG